MTEKERAEADPAGDFTFTHDGVTCLARRFDKSWHWCGYIRVESGHPWHGLNYTEIDASVHGGLTFSGEPEGHEGQWVGFDCAHFMDYVPRHESLFDRSRGQWRSLDYVQGELRDLVQQYKEAAAK